MSEGHRAVREPCRPGRNGLTGGGEDYVASGLDGVVERLRGTP